MTTLRKSQRAFVEAAHKEYGADKDLISRQDAIALEDKYGVKRPHWLFTNPDYRAQRGLYRMPSLGPVQQAPVAATEASVDALMSCNMQHELVGDMNTLIPPKAIGYVPFGHFDDVKHIIASKKFYPIYITGLSGNGKTLMVEQACSHAMREMIRTNITTETDEDDLLGGFRLVNGETIWHDGPVVQAMKRGAVLLLDEVDLGSSKLMCLQPVLEGKPIYLKKTNTVITPAKGFQIIATANTKGKGSDDGKFIGTMVMNEAFLERFSITMEQEYPAMKHEKVILDNCLSEHQITNEEWTTLLVKWGDIVRKTYADGGVDEIISTRRLVHIVEAFAIFNDKMKAISLCLNRFDEETKRGMLDMYTKLDAEARMPKGQKVEEEIKPVSNEPKEGDEIPF